MVAGFPVAPPVAPSAPRSLQFTTPQLGVVNLSWQVPLTGSQPLTYSVYYRHSQSGAYTLWGETSGLSASLEAQPTGASKSYYVTARNPAGTSPQSNTVTINPL